MDTLHSLAQWLTKNINLRILDRNNKIVQKIKLRFIRKSTQNLCASARKIKSISLYRNQYLKHELNLKTIFQINGTQMTQI